MGGQGREGLGRRAFAVVSLRGFQQLRANPAACGCRGRRRVALREWSSLLRSWGTSRAKLENRFDMCFDALYVFFLWADCRPNCSAGRSVPGLVAPVPPLHFGAVAQSAAGFLFHVYWKSFPRSPSQFSRPSGAPPPRTPSAVLRGSPHLRPELRVRSPLSPTLLCTTSLSLSGS